MHTLSPIIFQINRIGFIMKKTDNPFDSSKPIRTEPLPWELPGAHYLDEQEIGQIVKTIQSKSLFRFYGPDLQHNVDMLEHEFCQYTGRQFSLAVNSGTAALHIALSAFNIGPGDEVLVPGYWWVSCVSAIVRTGAIPRLVDIDDTFCMDPEDLKRKINVRSKVVLFIHMSGAMGRIEEVMAIAKEHQLKVLEDCAQSIGARLHGKPAGAYGDIAIYSFQLNKNMSCGEGGLLVCDDEELYKRCFALHDLGHARNASGRLDASDPLMQLWGIGARMSELAGAVALMQFKKLEKIVSAMRHSKYVLRNAIQSIPNLSFRHILDPAGDSGAFLIVLFPTASQCQQFTHLLWQEGIQGPPGSVACVVLGEVQFYWYYNTPSLVNKRSNSSDQFPWSHPSNAFAEEISYQKGALPQCDDLASRSLKLAIPSNLTAQDEQDIIQAFFKVSSKLG